MINYCENSIFIEAITHQKKSCPFTKIYQILHGFIKCFNGLAERLMLKKNSKNFRPN